MALVPFCGIYGRTEVRHLRRAAATASTCEMIFPNFQVTGYGLRAAGDGLKRCYELGDNGYGLWNRKRDAPSYGSTENAAVRIIPMHSVKGTLRLTNVRKMRLDGKCPYIPEKGGSVTRLYGTSGSTEGVRTFRKRKAPQ